MTIEKNHFDGGQNISEGHRRGEDKILSELIQDEQQDIQTVDATTAGGSATETLAFAGFDPDAGDTVISLDLVDNGTNNVSIAGYSNPAKDALDVEFSGDPGNDAVVRLTYRKAPAA